MFAAFMTRGASATPPEATSPPPAVLSEAEKYLQRPEEQPGCDILGWWAKNENDFPNLSKMARQYLGCPATSASAERVFSLAGRIYDDLSQSMSALTLEELMWAKVNRHC